MKLKYVFLTATVILLSLMMLISISADNTAFSESSVPGIDFELYTDGGEPLRILALNDINLSDAYGYRKTNFVSWTSEQSEYQKIEYADIQTVLLRYLNQAVSRTSPDIIVVTGNFARGIDDTKGQLFNYLCKVIDGYNIPWVYVCGSEERGGDYPFENKLADLEKYENCIFAKGDVTGYNYNIAVTNNGSIKEIIYVIDSENGENPDITEDREAWFAKSYEKVKSSYGAVPCYIFTNHAPRYMFAASKQYGVTSYVNPSNPLVLNTEEAYGQFNISPSSPLDSDKSFLELMKNCNTKGMFFGGESRIAASVPYEGIRLGYIMKTGLFGIKEGSVKGATLIEISGDSCSVEYYPYQSTAEMFGDIIDNAWYTDAIQYCYDRRLMSGMASDRFAPQTTLTRAMFITILANIEGIDKTEYQGSSFTDVKEGKWYSAAIQWGYRNGISAGYGSKFGVNDPLTREQMARMLMQYVKYKTDTEAVYSEALESYIDYSAISDWALEAMHWAHANKILVGTESADGHMMQPKAPATRAQIAVVVNSFYESFCVEDITHPERTGRRESEILFIGNSRIYFGEAPEKAQLLSDFYDGGYTCVDCTQPGNSMYGNYLNMLCRKEFDPEFFSEADKVVLLGPDNELALQMVMELFPDDTEFYIIYVWEYYEPEYNVPDYFTGYNVKIIPAGNAYSNMLVNGYDRDIFLAEDGFHPNNVMGYIEALTTYAVITGKDISDAPEDICSEYIKDIKTAVKEAVEMFDS
ncbi:MAG: S-layer homology domain-containing protein [Clostridia bacterium]|nr:S-layer homology domain-containing protein [Clostridia bacterium]